MKFRVRIARFPGLCHGGGEHPGEVDWLLQATEYLRSRDDISFVDAPWIPGATPITMMRNLAVKNAIKDDIDILIMVDADIQPDSLGGKPFLPRAIDFFKKRYTHSPTVVAAPYCGSAGPMHAKIGIQNVFAFHWVDRITDLHGDCNSQIKLAPVGRSQAAEMTGYHPMAAGPTGLIFLDMRVFTGFPHPDGKQDPVALRVDPKKAGWFYYEWADDECSEKASTEDVTLTRDVSMLYNTIGREAFWVDFSAWCIHHKVYPVGKPLPLSGKRVADEFLDAGNRYRASQDMPAVHVPGKEYGPPPPHIREQLAKQLAKQEPSTNGHPRKRKAAAKKKKVTKKRK